MTRAIKAVVFDLDGLMFNTEEVFYLAGCELLARRGRQMSRECMHRMIGRRPREAFAALVELYGLPDPIDVLLAESRQIVSALLEERVAPMPGLLDLLDQIEHRGLPKGVATSSPRHYAENMLGRFCLAKRFQVTLTAEDVTHGKPHPEIYQTAAARLGVHAAEMLVLEDSQAGVESAVAAGAVVVAVPHEHTRHQEFAGARLVVDGLHHPHIQALLGEGPGQPS